MIKRPAAFGAVILVIFLYLTGYFGVSPVIPRQVWPAGTRLRLAGRVALREETDYGIRLTLEEGAVLAAENLPSERSLNISSKLSEKAVSEIGSNTKITNSYETCSGLVQVYLEETEEAPGSGGWIAVEGILDYPKKATNPGQFDGRSYYQARNISFQLKKAKLLRQWPVKFSYRGLLFGIRERLAASMERVLGKEDAAVISAVTLGSREGLTSDQKRLYQEGGISHILAISSLHITLLGMGIYRLLRRFRWPIGCCCLVSGLFLFSFCVMTGMSVSARRACVMYLLWLGSQALGRTNDQPTGLALASFLILLPSPGYLWDSGFLLSFGCVLSLLYVTPLAKRLLPLPGSLGEAIQASAAIQIGTLPLMMLFFYQVTPYAFLVNLAVLPFMQLLMLAGLTGSVAGLLSVPAGTFVSAPCHYLLRWFELLCRLEKKLPGAVVITGHPQLWQVAVYYGVLTVICLGVRKKYGSGALSLPGRQKGRGRRAVFWHTGLLWLGCWVSVLLLSLRIPPGLRITFLDVGQGDSILIQADQFSCLIDGGSSSESRVWQYRIESALKYYGISRLDAVLVSHGDSDHISGLEELLEDYEKGYGGVNVGGITLERLLLPDTGYSEEKLEALSRQAKEKGILTGSWKAGGRLQSGPLELTCLYPNPACATGDSNQDSMVVSLKYRDFTALFTGDLESNGESRFLDIIPAGDNFQLDLLKVGHHGSGNGTSRELLHRLSPKAAVISCGKNNRYGHPAAETLERLKSAGTQIYRTDQNGAVTVEWRKGEAQITCFSAQ